MKNPFKAISLAILIVTAAAPVIRAQANINEGQETATLYLDVVNSNNNNSGSQSEPLKTIGQSVAVAEANNQSGIGTHVYVNPGLYRGNINLLGTGHDTALPETFEALQPGTVLISGADPYTNWTQYSGNSSIYSTPWTYNFGLCPGLLGDAPREPDIHLRREMAFIDGAPLQQVLSMSQMLEGAFYVDGNTCAGGLEPGNSCTLTVAFTPGTIAQTSPTLTIVDNARNGESIIIASGAGRKSVTITPQGAFVWLPQSGLQYHQNHQLHERGESPGRCREHHWKQSKRFFLHQHMPWDSPERNVRDNRDVYPPGPGIRLGNSCIHRRRSH
jgi:hypothetical protein